MQSVESVPALPILSWHPVGILTQPTLSTIYYLHTTHTTRYPHRTHPCRTSWMPSAASPPGLRCSSCRLRSWTPWSRCCRPRPCRKYGTIAPETGRQPRPVQIVQVIWYVKLISRYLWNDGLKHSLHFASVHSAIRAIFHESLKISRYIIMSI